MKGDLYKRLTCSIAVVLVLVVCLCVTSFALVMEILRTDGRLFTTGSVDIVLNGNSQAPIITAADCSFEPGATIRRTVTVENVGTAAVYYKLYFAEIQGPLADQLEVTILDGERTICTGKMSQLTANAVTAGEELPVGEERELTILFHYPESGTDSGQGTSVTFNLNVDAVQSKNNPTGLFE